MKVNRQSILAATILLLSAGCSNDHEGTVAPEGDERVALQVVSGIETRAYDKTWESGDAIGIYMLDGDAAEAENRKYTTATTGESGTFTADAATAIYFPVNGDPRDFAAYYPYRDIAAGSSIYPVDVTTQTPQKAIDLMAADKVTGKTKKDPAVAFEFQPKLVKLSLTIKPDGKSLTAADMEGLKVEITNQSVKATYDVLKGGEVNVTTPEATDNQPVDIELLTNAAGTSSEGIVLPNTSTKDMFLRFTLKGMSKPFTWNIHSAEKSKLFQAGSKYVYTITISKTGIVVTSTVKDWTAGNGEGGESGDAE